MQLIKDLEKKALDIRKDLLKLCCKESIHIGGDLSSTDILTALWQYKMVYNPSNPKDENRDRFVLSKSHAFAVTCFNQAAIGCFDKNDIYNEYATDEGMFSMHACSLNNPYVEVSTGSLGHGFPIACGIAKGLRLKGNNKSRVYVLMGDGELSEGSIWEAAMNASHNKLGNVVGIIDNNGISADGSIYEMTGLDSIKNKFEVFGCNVVEINGNEMSDIINALDNLPSPDSDKPTIIIAKTIKGCGIDFMENNPKWHAGKISQEQYIDSITKLNNRFKEKWNE